MSSDAPPSSFFARSSAVFWGLLGTWQFMALAASFLPGTLVKLAREGRWRPLILGVLLPFIPQAGRRELQDAWFGEFWKVVGPQVKMGAEVKVLPLLDGRVSEGKWSGDDGEIKGPGLGGVCIEIGAGSGFWVDAFSPRHLPAAAAGDDGEMKKRNTARTPVTRVYGVEPNVEQHPALRQAVVKAGLEDVYRIVPVGIEDLAGTDDKKWDGLAPESVDCIVTVLCLCSIPNPEENIRELYKYLKKGGRWYVYEHVKVEYSWYMKLYQGFVNLFWPSFLGGCQLCRSTETYLRGAGPWDKIDMAHPSDEMWFTSIPHILGVLTK